MFEANKTYEHVSRDGERATFTPLKKNKNGRSWLGNLVIQYPGERPRKPVKQHVDDAPNFWRVVE